MTDIHTVMSNLKKFSEEKKFSVKLLVYPIGASTNKPKSSYSFGCSSTSFQKSNGSTSSYGKDFNKNLYKQYKVGALHSAILYDDKWEFHFGCNGFQMVLREPNSTVPLETIDYGFTNKDFSAITDIIHNELTKMFNTSTYDLTKKNCHHFCNEFMKRIMNIEIPSHLTQLTERTVTLAAVVAGTAGFLGFIAAVGAIAVASVVKSVAK